GRSGTGGCKNTPTKRMGVFTGPGREDAYTPECTKDELNALRRPPRPLRGKHLAAASGIVLPAPQCAENNKMSQRSIKRVHPAVRDDIADLITQRPLPNPHLGQLDPFLFLNHHGPQTYAPHNRGLPFGPHPHRGFETVTFILDGMLTHQDSAGHESIIRAGGVQWMTAGRG